MNFWQTFEKPIIGLAPMDGVSDAAFRYITTKYSKPSVVITEFISVDGITHGADKLYTDFLYHPSERSIAAQIFGNDPELFFRSAIVVCELGFDGVDINMGCPAKSVAGRGAGAALIKTPELAQEIVKATKAGVEEWVANGTKALSKQTLKATQATKEQLALLGNKHDSEKVRKAIPTSVKTRIGFDQDVAEKWMEQLLEVKPANITVHGRTLKQMYTGNASWEALARAAAVVASYNEGIEAAEKITFLGNGDVNSKADLDKRLENPNFDGVLVGRATFGNPWIFRQLRGEQFELTAAERFLAAAEHARKHVELKGEPAFVQMRKHLAWYTKGLPGSAGLRADLVRTNNVAQVEEIFTNYLDNSPSTD